MPSITSEKPFPSAEGREVYQGEITIAYPWELPDTLHGPAVVFDVIAATHNIVTLACRVAELYVVTRDTVKYALSEIPDALLIGESDDPEVKGKCIATNSPLDVAKTEVASKKVVLITNNGTHTIAEVIEKGAQPVLAASYANLNAVAQWLLKNHHQAKTINLVPAGGREAMYAAHPNLLEDFLCAKATAELLQGKHPNLETYFAQTRQFVDQQYPSFWPTKEAELALVLAQPDLFPIVPVCEKQANGLLKVVPKFFLTSYS